MALFSSKLSDLEDKITLLKEENKQLVASLDETREALEEATVAHTSLVAEHKDLREQANADVLAAANQVEIIISSLAEAGIDLTDIDLFAESEDAEEDDEAADAETLIKAAVQDAVARQAAVITASRGIAAPIAEADEQKTGPETQQQFWAQYNAIEDLGARNEFYQAHKATLRQLPVG